MLNRLSEKWKDLKIDVKFRLVFTVLFLMIFILGGFSFFIILNISSTIENDIYENEIIFDYVTEINLDLEIARRLNTQFFLEYSSIGVLEAQEKYLLPSIEYIRHMISQGDKLKIKLQNSKVSSRLKDEDVDLNLYLSLADYFVNTSFDSADIVNELSQSEVGLIDRFLSHLDKFRELIEEHEEDSLHDLLHDYYYELAQNEKQYLLTTQRPFMQSTFNTLAELKIIIDNSPDMGESEKNKFNELFDNYVLDTEDLLEADVTLKSKKIFFELQAEITDSISQKLLTISRDEVDNAREQISELVIWTQFILIIIIISMLLVLYFVSNLLGKDITQNIVALTNFSKKFKAGNLNLRINMKRKDELGQLATGFNTMAIRIEDFVKNLESKVVERTQTLAKKVDELTITKKKLTSHQRELIKTKIELESFNTNLESMIEGRTEELKKSNVKIQKLLDVKNTFVNQVAHDLRTPITPIKVLIGIIIKKLKKMDFRTHKDIIENCIVVQNNSNYLATLVEQTLNIARMDAGTAHYEYAPINLCELCDEIIANNDIMFKSDGITVLNKIKKSIPSVYADKLRILELIQNLVGNSIKFLNHKTKKIIFSAEQKGNKIEISIKDTGIGMNKSILRKIFNEFYVEDQSRQSGSHGLGLFICKRIVEHHGGKIWADSDGENKGTTIFFTLSLSKYSKK